MRILPVLLAAAALTACSTTTGRSITKPGLNPMAIQRIAVVDGNNPTFKTETRQTLVDAAQFEFLAKGWNVIERSNIQKSLDEIGFQNGEITSPDARKQVGHVFNVDALTFVNIGGTADEMSITIKMVDVETGELLWMGQGDGSLNKGLGAVAGALTGAVVGAAVGHNVSRSGSAAGAGAAVGGIAGAAIGASLSDSALENAKKLVETICKDIPKRG